MEVVDFLKVRGEQKFKEEKNLIPLEIRIKNDRMQNILEIYEKNRGVADLICSLINNSLYHIIGVVNQNEIEKWDEIKISSRRVNVSFQSHEENRQARHFSYNVLTKNKNYLLNFTVKLIDSSNKDIEFIDGEKKFSVTNILIKFLI